MTDYCVKFTVLMRQSWGYTVNVITDGRRGVNIHPQDSAHAFMEMAAAGATLYTLADREETQAAVAVAEQVSHPSLHHATVSIHCRIFGPDTSRQRRYRAKAQRRLRALLTKQIKSAVGWRNVLGIRHRCITIS